MDDSRGDSLPPSALRWNAGGWFGGQAGCTVWMLILGLLVLPKDPLTAAACVAGFAVVNAWGLLLWRSRARVGAYSAFQVFLLVCSLVTGAVIVLVRSRGLAVREPGALVSTELPWGILGVGPALMLMLHLRERAARQGARGPGGPPRAPSPPGPS